MQLQQFIRPVEMPKHTGNAHSTNWARQKTTAEEVLADEAQAT